MTKLSICIVNYNTKDLTSKCIESLFQNLRDINFEIIVVDNASTDGSIDLLKQRFPMVIFIGNTMNLGFGKANNQAVKRSKGEYILFLNSDTYCTSDVIKEMINYADNNNDIGVVGIRLLNPDGTIQRSSHTFPSVKTVFFHIFKAKRFLPLVKRFLNKCSILNSILDKELTSYIFYERLNSPIEVDVVPGACMLVRKEILEMVRGFDENFFLYFEDIDLCKRIKKNNYKIILIPEVGIVHYGGASFRTSFLDFSPERYKGIIYYFAKHHSLIDNIVVRLLFIVIIPLKLIGILLKTKDNASKKKAIKSTLGVFYELLNTPLGLKSL